MDRTATVEAHIAKLSLETQKFRFPEHSQASQKTVHNAQKLQLPREMSQDSMPPPPPPKDSPRKVPVHSATSSVATVNTITSQTSVDSQSTFNPFQLQRTNSIYSLSRISFSNQISQLTSLQLPETASLSSTITAIPTSTGASRTLSSAAGQIRRWISKATEVLSGLDAEDDIEWAAAGGREGLDDVDKAVSRFGDLIGVYVGAIEELQTRSDISNLPSEDLRATVEQMETILNEWGNVHKLLRSAKEQVDMAMEWEELWNVVLGDIGYEMEELSRLVFEMEEARHNHVLNTADNEANLDMKDLETIAEDTPSGSARNRRNHRFSLPPAFAMSSPIQSPGPTVGHDDANLLALFARMQPLRASLDFLPMRLSTFQLRAEAIFPTSCGELEDRKDQLERKFEKLESDADSLRRELGEDRWVLVFRNAGRQAQKMCESVGRSISKLKEAIDCGAHHTNPPALWKKVESYEAKKTHYGPAIERVLAIIEKGLRDRLTVNGEILRLHADMNAMWHSLETSMKDLDRTLDELSALKTQQLRDSLSSTISNDRSATASGADTPSSSPASSIVTGPTGNFASMEPSTPNARTKARPGSMMPQSSTPASTRPGAGRRYFSMPPGSAGTSHIPRKTPTSHLSSGASTAQASRIASPTPGSRPTPVTKRSHRASGVSSDPRPPWNASVNTRDTIIGHNFKPMSLTTPSPHAKKPSLAKTLDTRIPHPRPREYTPSPASPSLPPSQRSSFTAVRPSRHPSQSPARNGSFDLPRPRLRSQHSTGNISIASEKRRSGLFEMTSSNEALQEEGDGDGEDTLRALPKKPEDERQRFSKAAARAAMNPAPPKTTGRRASNVALNQGRSGRVSSLGSAMQGKDEKPKPKWR